MISVFERRNTLEDLARKSKASLHSMYSEDGGRKRTMSDADRRHKTLTELGNLQSLSNLLAATSPNSKKKSDKFSFDDDKDVPSEIPKIMRQLSGHNHSGAGNFGMTGAGGAGALPASSDIINIVNSHFNDEESQQGNKKRDVSHMSYVYGDEESQHHKLPEYSADQEQMVNASHFEPKLPDLAEDEEHSKASTTYQTESHTKHTVIDVSMDQVQLDMDEQQKSPKNKMVIKIYPPSLQAVASKSPTGGNEQTYFE